MLQFCRQMDRAYIAIGKAKVGQIFHIIRDDELINVAAIKCIGTDMGNAVGDDQFLLIGNRIVERIFKGIFTNVFQLLVKHYFVTAMVVEGLVVDDFCFRMNGEAFCLRFDVGEIGQQAGVVAGVQIAVLQHEFRMVFVYGDIAQIDVPVQCAVTDMYQRSGYMQLLKEIVGESMVAYPFQCRRKGDAVATERKGIVANLLQRIG